MWGEWGVEKEGIGIVGGDCELRVVLKVDGRNMGCEGKWGERVVNE